MRLVFALSLCLLAVAKKFPRNYPKGFVRRSRAEQDQLYATTEVLQLSEADLKAVPDKLDWSATGATTPVKDQGVCGSCWAYSATEGIESALHMANLTMIPLAEQQIISCDTVGAAGCSGGDLPSALNYVQKFGGIESQAAYPDTSGDSGANGTCTADKSKVKAVVTGYKYAVPPCKGGNCTGQDVTGLMAALAMYGPISICINAGDSHWEFYETGLWPPASHPDCKSDWDLVDHCVQLVGYDKTAVEPYWKVKNSWGEQWGEKGFIRLKMNSGGNPNVCGIADEAVIVSATTAF